MDDFLPNELSDGGASVGVDSAGEWGGLGSSSGNDMLAFFSVAAPCSPKRWLGSGLTLESICVSGRLSRFVFVFVSFLVANLASGCTFLGGKDAMGEASESVL
jgi:hypothetical protein